MMSLRALAACLLMAAPAAAADGVIYSFNSGMNCYGVWALPDSSTGTISYTATAGEDGDHDPAATHPSYTVLNPVGKSSVTVDNVTGLMWVTNPVDAGFAGMSGAGQTWESALTSCTVTLNGLAYGGFTDWRLPDIKELLSIVDYGKGSVIAIDEAAFLNTVGGNYWSSTTNPAVPANAWMVGFYDGVIGNYVKTNAYRARCVRGP